MLIKSERRHALLMQKQIKWRTYLTVMKWNMCPNCNKQYKTSGSIKRHLKKVHEFSFDTEDQLPTSGKDHVAIYRASFRKCALLLRDTNDAYKMGDGNRVTTNAKFQMLLSRVGIHNKYQLWLFRYLAYIKCILSPKMAYEYMWNCSANLQGGMGKIYQMTIY